MSTENRGSDRTEPAGEHAGDAGYDAAPQDERLFRGLRGPTPRSTTLGVALVVMLGLLAVMVLLPAPYAVRAPGPTENTLGTQDGKDLITISGAKTYPASGELRLTTVSVSGGPGYPAQAPAVVRGWLDAKDSVYPVEELFPPDESADQVAARNEADMVSSQESATVAALTEAGYDVPVTLTVQGTVPDSGADGVLEKGDVIVALDGEKIVTYQDLIDRLDATTPGDDVVVGVRRDGAAKDVTVTTGGSDGRTVLGVLLGTDFDMPVDVDIQIGDIGGPSAGTMFALGIVDKLTPADEAGGKVIAGTGTMGVDGVVGPIGGIRQKLYGAQRDGAAWFLAPESNCDEVVGHVPPGLHVAAVGTLDEAVDAMTAIGSGKGSGLTSCEDVAAAG
ncbi:PDZ domain-containing protein [Cellulomonas sp. PhB143]|uniref:YlbL family protein n=1 Tax=Cellulomonas sp. PhB143 TaxID=2485186 RepID=UPI000FB0F6E2|nr:PDZ domain-containing protein [Cellulomonas sp. PhB143]ROS76869.1 PDZ domain-containing protein [Cellulomonas sp. PhB143]